MPISLKATGELEKTWEVGKHLLKKEYSRAISLIISYHWIIAEDISKLLKNKLIEDTKKRVIKSYISIEISKLALLLSMQPKDTIDLVKRWNWEIKDNYAYPVHVEREFVKNVEENDILLITQLVGYLEQKMHIGID